MSSSDAKIFYIRCYNCSKTSTYSVRRSGDKQTVCPYCNTEVYFKVKYESNPNPNFPIETVKTLPQQAAPAGTVKKTIFGTTYTPASATPPPPPQPQYYAPPPQPQYYAPPPQPEPQPQYYAPPPPQPQYSEPAAPRTHTPRGKYGRTKICPACGGTMRMTSAAKKEYSGKRRIVGTLVLGKKAGSLLGSTGKMSYTYECDECGFRLSK